MNTAKTLITWILVCVACAGATIVAIQALDQPLGLRTIVATFAQPIDTH
jgi:hypothetical protein